MTTIDVDELDDEHEQRRTFRYSNGAPLVSDPEDPEKTLRYSRPSGYSKALDDEKALESWRIWKSMTGVARSPALAAEVNACKDEDRTQKEVLRNKALDKGDASEKADMGTALHAMTVRAEDQHDVDFDPPEQYVPDLTAYTDALRDLRAGIGDGRGGTRQRRVSCCRNGRPHLPCDQAIARPGRWAHRGR